MVNYWFTHGVDGDVRLAVESFPYPQIVLVISTPYMYSL